MSKQVEEAKRLIALPCDSLAELKTLQRDVHRWTDYNIQLMKSLFSDDSLSDPYKRFRGRLSVAGAAMKDIAIYEKANIADQLNQLVSDAQRLELFPTEEDRGGASTPPSRKSKNTVFLGHGRSRLWMDLDKFLTKGLNLDTEEFNSQSAAGLSFKERLQGMLNNADFAFIIMTAEDEHPDGAMHARENVIHEAGLFQGKLGFEKAIILLEDGCAEFSNKQGLVHISFPKGNIMAAAEEIRRVLSRENITPS